MIDTVIAKFTCKSITRRQHWDRKKGETQTISLEPVTSGSPENEAFYEATPSGSIILETLNAEAGNYFQLGRNYYIRFEAEGEGEA